MKNIKDFMRFAYSNAYYLGKSMKKNYSVGISNAKGDLSKRWYVWYSFRNPQTGKLERQGTIDTNVNTHKTAKGRMRVLLELQRLLERGLEDGIINPYQNTTPNNTGFATPNINQNTGITTTEQAFEILHKYAQKNYKDTTISQVETEIKKFHLWIKTNKILYVEQITRRDVEKYLNEMELKTSIATRNNSRTILSMYFATLVKEHIVERNFIRDISLLKSKPKRHKIYTLEQEAEIFKRLEEVDKLLGLFIKFISFNMLRPIEVCRLQVKSINIKEKKLYFEAKNKAYKTKIIPDILLKELPDLSMYDDECYLFTPKGIAIEKNSNNKQRRTYWSRRFKKVVKDYFKLEADYTMYSFRHTFITKMYNELTKQYAPFEAKSRLMLITGHASMSSLEKYLRDIDATLPDDYSKYLL